MHDPQHALSLQGPSNAAIQACMYKGRELVTYRAYLTLLCHAAVSQCQISVSCLTRCTGPGRAQRGEREEQAPPVRRRGTAGGIRPFREDGRQREDGPEIKMQRNMWV